MMDPRDREIESLEQQLLTETCPQEREGIQRDLRDLGMDTAEEADWLDEGIERGWF